MKLNINILIFMIIFIGGYAFSQALRLNIVELMAPTEDMRLQSMIQRFYRLQQREIEQKIITSAEAKCIAAASVHVLKQDGLDFLDYAEQAQRTHPEKLSVAARTNLIRLVEKHQFYLDLVRQNCQQWALQTQQ